MLAAAVHHGFAGGTTLEMQSMQLACAAAGKGTRAPRCRMRSFHQRLMPLPIVLMFLQQIGVFTGSALGKAPDGVT
jgi:hypothetical protein